MRLGYCPLIFVGLMLPLSACGLFSAEYPEQTVVTQSVSKQTLGDVFFEPLPLDHTPLEQPETQSMRDSYKALLDVVGDPETRKIVQYRLADLEVSLAEQKQEDGAPLESTISDKQVGQKPQKLFDLAIQQYQQLLGLFDLSRFL